MEKSELQLLVEEIKSSTSQVSINKMDEVNVMKCMLNDPNFSLSVYDKKGYVGQRCPREEAVKFVKNIISATTGLDSKDSKHLAENYEFARKDAVFLLDNMRDFMSVYMDTGRKMNILQTENSDASIYLREVKGGKVKSVPDKENPGKKKQITTKPFLKLVSQSKCPKYKEE